MPALRQFRPEDTFRAIRPVILDGETIAAGAPLPIGLNPRLLSRLFHMRLIEGTERPHSYRALREVVISGKTYKPGQKLPNGLSSRLLAALEAQRRVEAILPTT